MKDRILRKGGRRRGGIATWLLTLTLTLGVTGCGQLGESHGQGAEGPVDAEQLSFPGSPATLDGLARQVLASLVGGDTVALARLRLTEHEHNSVVWPELPAARPEVGFPVDLAWDNIELRNRRSLARTLPVFGGLDLTPEGVQCRGGRQTYETFHVLTDCWTIFVVEGREGLYEAQPFEEVLVRGGGHRVFRYHETRPSRVDAKGAW